MRPVLPWWPSRSTSPWTESNPILWRNDRPRLTFQKLDKAFAVPKVGLPVELAALQSMQSTLQPVLLLGDSKVEPWIKPFWNSGNLIGAVYLIYFYTVLSYLLHSRSWYSLWYFTDAPSNQAASVWQQFAREDEGDFIGDAFGANPIILKQTSP